MTDKPEYTESPSMTGSTHETPLRQSRIHFPVDSEISRSLGPSVAGGSALERSPKAVSPVLPSSILRRHDVQRERNGERKRVKSVDVQDLTFGNSVRARAQPVAGPSGLGPNKGRAVSYTPHRSNVHEQEEIANGDSSFSSSFLGDDSDGQADEDAQDPNIIADVQRALKYKARVEARLRAAKSNPGLNDSAASVPRSPTSSLSGSSLPQFPTQPFSLPGTPPPRLEQVVKHEIVDFSPSVGVTPLHPVPSSSNDGTTLDWSREAVEEDKRERKWSLPLSRKAHKDKPAPVARKGVVEKQESLYADKLTRIKAKATPQTLRKAEIARDQLQRRYNVVGSTFASRDVSLNTASAVRWFDSQDDTVKRAIDEAEPLFWLRHLTSKSGKKSIPRLPWLLSALIVEEYIRTYPEADAKSSIREEFSTTDVFSESGLYGPSSNIRAPSSRPASFRSTDAIATNRRTSDDLISFEPLTQSLRNSVGEESHKSFEKQMRGWRNSVPDMESPSDSLGSLKNGVIGRHHQHGSPSPVSSNRSDNVKGPAKRLRSRHDHSDDGSSSALDSFSEDQHELGALSAPKVKRPRPSRVVTAELKAPKNVGKIVDRSGISLPLPVREHTGVIPDTETPRPTNYFPLPQVKDEDLASVDLPPQRKPVRLKPFTETQRMFTKYRTHGSLPSSPRVSATDFGMKSAPTDEQEGNQWAEYERKKDLLIGMKAQNATIKTLLQSALRTVQEYDEMQRNLSATLRLPYTRISLDVLDSLSHDPDAVVGNTRRLSGWRAVEDIHERRTRQTEVLRSFMASLPKALHTVPVTSTGFCRKPALALSRLVEQLSHERQQVLDSVQRASTLLLHDKKLRDRLKPDFGAAERHTSANYPELVRLEALLDKFVNKRNQLWRLGETSLSLILSSSAPFMKTFGRPIWNDVHDLLVIPWYRNDFSGEAQWYPVKFPKRNALHWLRLLLFALGAPLGLISTLRTAITLSAVKRLAWVPYFVPWVFAGIIHSFVMLGLWTTAAILLATVLGECAIVLWWTAWMLKVVE